MSERKAPSSKDTDMRVLLERIASGKLQLPEFQRDWTWDDARIRAILASLTQGYPMGAVMCLQCGGEARFKARPFAGAGTPSEEPEYLVLDGQQRLTSIFRAAWSREPVYTKTDKGQPVRRFYYLDIAKCLDPAEDRLDAVVSVPEDRVLRGRDGVLDLSTQDGEFKAGMFPMNIVFDGYARERWADGWKKFHGHEDEWIDRYSVFREEVLVVASEYRLPVITMLRETPKEAVCKVFENVNTGGVQLTVFELVTAAFAAEDFDLRRDWEKCRSRVWGEGSGYGTDLMQNVDETAFLAAATLFSTFGKGAPSSKRKDILDLTCADYKAARDAVLDGFDMARTFLLRQYVFRKRDLPYPAQIVPLAAICAALGWTVFNRPASQKILSRWFWCAVLGEAYGSAAETRGAMDVADVVNAVRNGGGEIRTVGEAFFSAGRLLGMQGRQSAAYKGVMALIYRSGGRDFMQETGMDLAKSMAENPDIHHIFPRKWCATHGVPPEKRDSIVNKTPLLPATNLYVGGNAPSAYSRKIMDAFGMDEARYRASVESCLVDWDAFIADDFDAFFVERAKRLLDLVEAAMGKAVADRDSEQTIAQFGASLAREEASAGDASCAGTARDAGTECGGASSGEGTEGALEPASCESPVAPESDAGEGPSGGGDEDADTLEDSGGEAWPGHERDLVSNAGHEASALYGTLRSRLCSLGDVSVDPRRMYVSFKTSGIPFLSVVVRQEWLKLIFNAKQGGLKDPRGLLKPNREHCGPGECYADLSSWTELEAVLDLAGQSFEAARARAGASAGEAPCTEAGAGEPAPAGPGGGAGQASSGGSAEAQGAGAAGDVPVAEDRDPSRLLAELKKRVIAFGGVEVKEGKTKTYLSFYVPGRPRFLAALQQKSRLLLYLRTKGMKLNDPKGMTVKSWSNPRTERLLSVTGMTELEDAMPLVRQSFRKLKD
ncbi:MAG: DUF262 domain-containing protein [Desulfovibrio sp.]|nr:DUF262 domain-containing protein [Desulfovibrio sp.]